MFSNTKDKTDPTKDTKVYGCAVMSMDLYSTGIPFKNKNTDPKYIDFNSEVVVKKGDEGWVINSKVDNHSNDVNTYFDYVLTTYKYEDKQWKAKSKKWWKDTRTLAGTSAEYSVSDSNGNDIYVVWAQNNKLVIKTPKESWWNGPGWISMDNTGGHKIVRKIKTETKSWSGVWVDDVNNRENSWIFEDIELYIEDKKNSLMFCDGEKNTCFNVYQQNDKFKKSNKDSSESWNEILRGSSTNEVDTLKGTLTNTVKPIIDKIKGSRGTWLDLESVCNLKDIRNLNDSQKKQLSTFCTKGKKSN